MIRKCTKIGINRCKGDNNNINKIDRTNKDVRHCKGTYRFKNLILVYTVHTVLYLLHGYSVVYIAY